MTEKLSIKKSDIKKLFSFMKSYIKALKEHLSEAGFKVTKEEIIQTNADHFFLPFRRIDGSTDPTFALQVIDKDLYLSTAVGSFKLVSNYAPKHNLSETTKIPQLEVYQFYQVDNKFIAKYDHNQNLLNKFSNFRDSYYLKDNAKQAFASAYENSYKGLSIPNEISLEIDASYFSKVVLTKKSLEKQESSATQNNEKLKVQSQTDIDKSTVDLLLQKIQGLEEKLEKTSHYSTHAQAQSGGFTEYLNQATDFVLNNKYPLLISTVIAGGTYVAYCATLGFKQRYCSPVKKLLKATGIKSSPIKYIYLEQAIKELAELKKDDDIVVTNTPSKNLIQKFSIFGTISGKRHFTNELLKAMRDKKFDSSTLLSKAQNHSKEEYFNILKRTLTDFKTNFLIFQLDEDVNFKDVEYLSKKSIDFLLKQTENVGQIESLTKSNYVRAVTLFMLEKLEALVIGEKKFTVDSSSQKDSLEFAEHNTLYYPAEFFDDSSPLSEGEIKANNQVNIHEYGIEECSTQAYFSLYDEGEN